VDEAPLVHGIMREAFAEYAGRLPVESGALRESVADVATAMRAGGAVLCFLDDGAALCLLDDVAVGSARFLVEDDALYVNRVAVLPAYRRRGIASALMSFLEDVARSRGKNAIRIGVRESLPSNIALYEALGYGTVSIDRHPGGPDKSRTMLKALTDP
jgi:ribosomal protein S18 acetylase RimI-like enzyme